MNMADQTRIYIAAWRQFSVRRVAESVLGAFGILWLLVESTAFFSQAFADAIRPYWWVFPVLAIPIGLYRGRPRLAVTARVAGTDSHVEIRVGDVFSHGGAVIIGSNTTFDTSMEDDVISPRSVQGQFTREHGPSVEELDRALDAALQGVVSTERTTADKPYGKREEYPFGTVACVECGGRRAYFLAIARLNEHKTALGSLQDVLDSLPRLWEFLRTRGDLEPVCCPILGSGYSRVNATREALIREIVRSYVAAATFGPFCERLVIAISRLDLQKGEIDLGGLGRFIEHECLYAVAPKTRSAPTGSPVASSSQVRLMKP